MTYEDRLERINALMNGHDAGVLYMDDDKPFDAAGWDKAKKKTSLSDSAAKAMQMFEEMERRDRMLAQEQRMNRMLAQEQMMMREIESLSRHEEMSGLRRIVTKGGTLGGMHHDHTHFSEGPYTHRYRYPVQNQRARGFMSEDKLPPRELSFTEHEVRYTEGQDTVEIWEGQNMICRVPVIGLQTVLMDELS